MVVVVAGGEKKKWEGVVEDAGKNPCTFNYDQEVFPTKGWRRCSSVALVNLARMPYIVSNDYCTPL